MQKQYMQVRVSTSPSDYPPDDAKSPYDKLNELMTAEGKTSLVEMNKALINRAYRELHEKPLRDLISVAQGDLPHEVL